MPHLANSEEKISMILEKHLQEKRFLDISSVKIYDLIEEIIDKYIPIVNNEYFDKFVDIKEVPYGRHNSDPDYRGSGTKLP